MAQTETQTKTPDYLAWQVTASGEKNHWTKLGAAWAHRDGKGLSLQLDALPVNGRITLRVPQSEDVK